MNTLIVYHSDYGHTKEVGQAIAAGVKTALAEHGMSSNVMLKLADDVSLDDMRVADVLIFGTPVHMGSMAWQMKKLIDSGSKLWMQGELEGKVGGVFTTHGGFGGSGGGSEHTLIALHANFLEQGMLVCGFPRSLSGYAHAGLHWGLSVRTGDGEGMPEGVSEEALVAARAYGSHVLDTAIRLQD
ncbi:MAG: NAD(P)H-dependent oxidoreductase [Ghiorsea sp.]